MDRFQNRLLQNLDEAFFFSEFLQLPRLSRCRTKEPSSATVNNITHRFYSTRIAKLIDNDGHYIHIHVDVFVQPYIKLLDWIFDEKSSVYGIFKINIDRRVK